MNYPQSLTHEPTGRSIVWMVHHLPDWLNPPTKAAHKRNKEFPEAIARAVTVVPLTIHEIYAAMPARFRSVADYKNLNTQLSRMYADGRIKRTGLCKDYRYYREIAKVPRL